MRFIKALNEYFICDKDEQVNVGEAVFFYSVIASLSIAGLIFTVLTITF